MGSEVGVKYFPPQEIVEKGRLRPGKMLLIDTKEGKIHYDPELKESLATHNPYKEWLTRNMVNLEDIEVGERSHPIWGICIILICSLSGITRKILNSLSPEWPRKARNL